MEKAKEGFGKFSGFVKEKWSNANKNARTVTLLIAASLVVAVIIMVAISNRVDFAVLYTGVATSEDLSDITAALNELGITARIDGQVVSVPRESVDSARMQLAIQGFPRTGFNYDIWNEGVGMFSTDSERREIQRQQLAQNISATLRNITDVQDAIVIVHPAEEDRFVYSPNRKPAMATVLLTLRQPLNSQQIEGVYNLVMTSVPELKRENITVANQHGVTLIPEDATTAEANLALEMQRMNMQMELERTMETNLERSLERLFRGTVRDIRFSVAVGLDFSDWERQTTEYEGVNVDERNFQHGVVNFQEQLVAWNAIGIDGGLVGTTNNADISPDFPTYIGDGETEGYYERQERTDFLVNEFRTVARSNGFDVRSINVAMIIDDIAAPQDQLDAYRNLAANAVGTSIENVSVMTVPFQIEAPEPQPPSPVIHPVRNMLVFIIIALGALLIILLMLAIMSSGSKKRRTIRARMAAYQGAGGTPSFEDDLGAYAPPKIVDEEPDKIEIQSLLGSGDGETRDALLKNEIREFAKTNPDIVAQLIRTWIREA